MRILSAHLFESDHSMRQAESIVVDEGWQLSPASCVADDPLLGCLLIVARMHNKPASADALTAGLPLVEHRLTPELFVRASGRAGLSAKLVKRSLDAISDLVLPCVLLLEGKGACVLVGKAAGTAQIILSESGSGESAIDLEQLRRLHTGYPIFARPAHRFHALTADTGVPPAAPLFCGAEAPS